MGKKLLYSASTYSHLKNFHLPYLRRFRELGWEVHAVCGGTPMDLPEVDRVIHMPFTKRMTAPANLRCTRQIARLIREEGYDLVSTHTALAAFFTRLAVPRRGARPRVVNTVHGYLFGAEEGGMRHSLLLGAERLTAGVTDLVLTMNGEDLELAERYRLGEKIVATPGMGVALERFPPQTAGGKAAARRALGLEPEDFLLVYAAEFSGRKNQRFLIEQLPRLPRRVKYLLLGAGELWEGCRARAEELGVGDRVHFPGHVDTLPYLTAGDVCMTASNSEGLPFNVMEAMAVGLPIVATAVKGHRDLLTGPMAEFLFPPGDGVAFVQAVTRLEQEEHTCDALAEYGRRAMEPYGIDRVLPGLMDLYGAREDRVEALLP